MSRSMFSDAVENESSADVARISSKKHIRTTKHNSRQTQTQSQIPATVAYNTKPTFKGNVSSTPRALHSNRTRPNTSRANQRDQKCVCIERFQIPASASVGLAVPAAHDNERGPTPSVRLSDSSVVLDPSESEPEQDIRHSPPLASVAAGHSPTNLTVPSVSASHRTHYHSPTANCQHRSNTRKQASIPASLGHGGTDESERCEPCATERSGASQKKTNESIKCKDEESSIKVGTEAFAHKMSSCFDRKKHKLCDKHVSKSRFGITPRTSFFQNTELSVRPELESHSHEASETLGTTSSDNSRNQGRIEDSSPTNISVERVSQERSDTPIHPAFPALHIQEASSGKHARPSACREGEGQASCATLSPTFSECNARQETRERFAQSQHPAGRQSEFVGESRIMGTSESQNNRNCDCFSVSHAQEGEATTSDFREEDNIANNEEREGSARQQSASRETRAAESGSCCRGGQPEPSPSNWAISQKCNRKRRRGDERGGVGQAASDGSRKSGTSSAARGRRHDAHRPPTTASLSGGTTLTGSHCDAPPHPPSQPPASSTAPTILSERDERLLVADTHIKEEAVDEDYDLHARDDGMVQVNSDSTQNKLDRKQTKGETDLENDNGSEGDIFGENEISKQWSILFETAPQHSSQWPTTGWTDWPEDRKDHIQATLLQFPFSECHREERSLPGTLENAEKMDEAGQGERVDNNIAVATHIEGRHMDCTSDGECSPQTTKAWCSGGGEVIACHQQRTGRRKQKTPRHFQKELLWQPPVSDVGYRGHRPAREQDQPPVAPHHTSRTTHSTQSDSAGKRDVPDNLTGITENGHHSLPSEKQEKRNAEKPRLFSNVELQKAISPAGRASWFTFGSDSKPRKQPATVRYLAAPFHGNRPVFTESGNTLTVLPDDGYCANKETPMCAEDTDVQGVRNRTMFVERQSKEKRTRSSAANKYCNISFDKANDRLSRLSKYFHGIISPVIGNSSIKLPSAVDNHPLLQSKSDSVPDVDINGARNSSEYSIAKIKHVPFSRNKVFFRSCIAPKCQKQVGSQSQNAGFSPVLKTFSEKTSAASCGVKERPDYGKGLTLLNSPNKKQVQMISAFAQTPCDLLRHETSCSSSKPRPLQQEKCDDGVKKLCPEIFNKSIREIMALNASLGNSETCMQENQQPLHLKEYQSPHNQKAKDHDSQHTHKSSLSKGWEQYIFKQRTKCVMAKQQPNQKQSLEKHSQGKFSNCGATGVPDRKISETMKARQPHTKSNSQSMPATLVPGVRFPCISVPLYSAAFSGVTPALPQTQVNISASSSMTTAGLESIQSTPQQTEYIPIVPKAPMMMPATQTQTPAFGYPHVVSNFSSGQCSGYVAGSNVFTGLNIQQGPVRHGNEERPQTGVLANQDLSAACGSIPVFFFFLSSASSLTQSPVQSQQQPTLEKAETTAWNTPVKEESVKGKHSKFKESSNSNGSSRKTENCETKDTDSGAQLVGSSKEDNWNVDCMAPGNSSIPSHFPATHEATKSSSSSTIHSTSLQGGTLVSNGRPHPSQHATSSDWNKSEKPIISCQDGRHFDSPELSLHDALVVDKEPVKSSSSIKLFPTDDILQPSKTVQSDVLFQVPNKEETEDYTHVSPTAAEAGRDSPKVLKSGRKRIVPSRYTSHTDVDLSDATENGDMTPITSDDEWTPGGQSAVSSEEEEKMSQRRDKFQDLFHPASTSWAKWTQFGMRTKKQSNSLKMSATSTLNTQPQIKSEPLFMKQTSIDCRPEQPVPASSTAKPGVCTTQTNSLAISTKDGKQRKPSATSSGKKHAQPPPKAPRKRRKTPYTKDELTCRICSKSFINIYRLRRHEFSHGNERPYVCEVCGKAFKQSGHRNEHRLTHSANKRSFLCNVCGVVISSRSSFRYHLLSHKQILQGMVRTARCEIVTRDSNVYPATQPSPNGTRHLTKEAVDWSLHMAAYDCPHCSQRFATAQSLNCHLETHLEVELRCHVQPFTCGECGRSFTYRHNLEKHLAGHVKPEKRADSYQRKVKAAIAAGKPYFVCDTCGKVFLRKETLTKHIKTHLGLKPYQCMVCSKSFTQKIHLTVHSRLHTGSRPFQCRVCRCCFLDSTALARHVERDVCKTEGFTFNVGKRGRKPLHMAVADTANRKRDRTHTRGSKKFHCGLCTWAGRHQGFLRRHVQRCHPVPDLAIQRKSHQTSLDVDSTAGGTGVAAGNRASSRRRDAHDQREDTMCSQQEPLPHPDTDPLHTVAKSSPLPASPLHVAQQATTDCSDTAENSDRTQTVWEDKQRVTTPHCTLTHQHRMINRLTKK